MSMLRYCCTMVESSMGIYYKFTMRRMEQMRNCFMESFRDSRMNNRRQTSENYYENRVYFVVVDDVEMMYV